MNLGWRYHVRNNRPVCALRRVWHRLLGHRVVDYGTGWVCKSHYFHLFLGLRGGPRRGGLSG